MRIRILGSAAGGGLPQWNCNCTNCTAARSGSQHVRPRTQSSVAISADDCFYFLLNASADVRSQLAATGVLAPPAGNPRGTPIAGCLLTDAEIDHSSGLLQLREGCSFSIHSTPLVREWLTRYFPIGPILTPFADRPWHDLPLERELPLLLPSGQASGLSVSAFALGIEVPRFVPNYQGDAVGSRVGLAITDTHSGGKLVYAPGVSTVNDALRAASDGASCVLVDGTFWEDEEPRRMNITDKTASQMGHIPISGPAGSLAWLAGLPVPHRVYVHLNNTNPVLNEAGPERRAVSAAGVRVSMDGDEFQV